ncbi:uncharacterized protein LOC127736429 [Mytilus californianus]|uniref:uncharacterized protein LOC127736429 n=1 Tax=Mytilus californianus TaxID=6549 RepID=UPI0022457302|nr:uncharacterized protein LOC127736429 [Mytilus californianus]
MPVTPEDRRAKLGCVILRLFPKVMQIILKEYISLRGLRGKFQLKDVRTAFTKKEISLMEQLPCIDDFTVELCYKILRYENVMPEPSCKWGNIPHDTEVEVADDIQRIINTINDVISKKCEDISEEFYDEYLKKIKDITKRIDGHLHHDTCIKLYTTICSSDMNHLCILQDLTLMQAINVSQIVDEDGETKECFSRMSFVITDTFPNILRDVIRSSIHANRLYKLCIPHLRNFSPDQQNCLQDLDLSNSYGSLDVSLIYRLLKQFQLISPPTKGWGIFPCKVDNRLGDDVERIRYYRNQMAHKTNIRIERTEFENYFDSFRDIGHKMDINFFQKTNYEETIILHKTCRIDIHMQNKYINTLKELENIKLIFERTPIKFYWGNSFNRSLVQLRSIIQDEKSKGREKVRVQIIFQTESDIERTIDILNSLRDDINKGLSGIEFIVAKKGSIVIKDFGTHYNLLD